MRERNPNLKIIIVDDSEFSRRSVVEILEKEGFNVVGQADSAEKALQLFHTTSNVNLFIIDIIMPEISGIDLAKKIQEKSLDIKMIMMSCSLIAIQAFLCLHRLP